jgi:hypothetical protein
MNPNKIALIAVRDAFQSLLDNYQVMDTAMVTFKGAMVGLNNIIETPDAAPVTVMQPVTGTADVVAGVLAGLAGISADVSAQVLAAVQAPLSSITDRIAAMAPPPPIDPVVLAPTADQLAAAQAVIAAQQASQSTAAAQNTATTDTGTAAS